MSTARRTATVADLGRESATAGLPYPGLELEPLQARRPDRPAEICRRTHGVPPFTRPSGSIRLSGARSSRQVHVVNLSAYWLAWPSSVGIGRGGHASREVQNLNCTPVLLAVERCGCEDLRAVLSHRQGVRAPSGRWSIIILRNIVILGCRTFNEIADGALASLAVCSPSGCGSWSGPACWRFVPSRTARARSTSPPRRVASSPPSWWRSSTRGSRWADLTPEQAPPGRGAVDVGDLLPGP